MINTQTAIKEAIFALEHGNKTWKALGSLKAALAENVLPPRLTDVEMLKHRPFWSLKFTDDAILEITRAIETAVRKQFGVE